MRSEWPDLLPMMRFVGMFLAFNIVAVPLLPESEGAEQARDVRLTARVVRQDYCAGDDELYTIHLKIRLKYTNISAKRLIIHKSSGLIGRAQLTPTSRTGRDQENKPVEISYDVVSNEERKPQFGDVPAEGFVILKPNESYEADSQLAIIARRPGMASIANTATSGTYQLRVFGGTWPYSRALASKLNRRWIEYGRVFAEDILSEPFDLTVAENPPIAPCVPAPH